MGKRHRVEDKNGKRKSNIYSELFFYVSFSIKKKYVLLVDKSIFLNSMGQMYVDQKLCGTGLNF